jgi:type VI protein secretion system component Hcp
MRKSDDRLEQESSAKTEISVGLSDNDLDKVTGGGKANTEAHPTETISLSYGKIEWVYTPQK